MRTVLVLFCLLQPAVLANGEAPTLELPAQVQAQPGQIFVVEAKTNLKWRRWTVPSGLTRVPPELTKAGDNAFIGYGPAGVYEFRIEGTKDDQFKDGKCVVFVGTPQPGPIPPIPPAPSDLVGELQLLFTADKGTVDQRDKLVSLWRSSAEQVEGNPKWNTLGTFAQAMHAVASDFPFHLTDDVLKGVRTKLAAELTTSCGPGTTELGTPGSAVRKKAAGILNKYSAALGAVK